MCLAEARAVYPKQMHGPTGKMLRHGSEAARLLDIDMANGLHKQMKPSELRATRECYQAFSPKRFSQRIDQKREAAKPYGMNPMQAAAKKEEKDRSKIKNRPDKSRKESVDPYINSKRKLNTNS